jgi:hypothetical protein
MIRRLSLLATIVLSGLVASASPLAAQSAGPAAPRPAQPQLPSDSLQRARKYVAWLFNSQNDSLWASLDSLVKPQLESPAVFDELAADLAIRAGSEDRLIDERWVNRLGKRQYWRTSKYSDADEPFILRLVILPNGKLAGMGLNALSAAPPTDP